MANVLVNEQYLEDIATAIREKNGTLNTYKPGDMAAAISAIEGGGEVVAYGDYRVFLERNYTAVDTLIDDYTVNLVEYAFYQNDNIKTVELNKVETVNSSAFSGCDKLVKVCLPSLVAGCGLGAFYECSALKYLDFGMGEVISGQALGGCTALETLILRANKVITAHDTAFNGSSIANGTGYIYVPSSLVNSYKSTAPWSNYPNQIRAIEDYPEIVNQ